MEHYDEMGSEELGASMPASPNAEYYNSSSLSLVIIAVMEMELPYDPNIPAIQLLKSTFLPINPRFSSIMVQSENHPGKKWKPVHVNVENHLKIANFPDGKPIEFYDKCLENYLGQISMDRFPEDQPLWEVHVFKYPSSKASWHLIFKLHHCLGDGYSLVGALLSTMQRADDPSLPLTFPSRQSQTSSKMAKGIRDNSMFKRINGLVFGFVNTFKDFGTNLLRSSVLHDDQTSIRSGKDLVELCPMSITTVKFSLDQLKHVKTKLGVTINDLILGIIFCGIRLYMKKTNGGISDAIATALVVFNERDIGGGYKSVEEMLKPKAEMPWGNRFGFIHLEIPVASEDDAAASTNPLYFVMQAHRIIKRKRNSAAVLLTTKLLQTMCKLRGSEVTSKYLHSVMKNTSMLISNVIGPNEKMGLYNQPVRGIYYTLTGVPQSLVITMMSYMGELNVVFGTEKDYIDTQLFKSCIHHALDIILKASEN